MSIERLLPSVFKIAYNRNVKGGDLWLKGAGRIIVTCFHRGSHDWEMEEEGIF